MSDGALRVINMQVTTPWTTSVSMTIIYLALREQEQGRWASLEMG